VFFWHRLRRPVDLPRVPDTNLYGTGKWCRVLIDATINLDFEPQANYGGDRYPPMVKPEKEDWERVERRWAEYGFKRE
jgi:hypothetical protein